MGLQAEVRYINRDAAALLLSRSAATSDGGGGLAFIDVRRHDERTLYGSIPRAQHVPGALPRPLLQSMTRGLAYDATYATHSHSCLSGGITRSHLCRAVDELPAALQLNSTEWAERYRFPKPGAGAPVVLQCRTQRRATWAAQLAADAGLHNVLVYKQVTHSRQGWKSCLDQCRSMSGCLWELKSELVVLLRAQSAAVPPTTMENFEMSAGRIRLATRS